MCRAMGVTCYPMNIYGKILSLSVELHRGQLV